MFINDIPCVKSLDFVLRLKVIGENISDNLSYSYSHCDCNDFVIFPSNNTHPNLDVNTSYSDITLSVDDGVVSYKSYLQARAITGFCIPDFKYRKLFRCVTRFLAGYVGKPCGFKFFCYGNNVDFDSFYIIPGRPSLVDSSFVDLFNYGRLVYCGKNIIPNPNGFDLLVLDFDENFNSSLENIISNPDSLYSVLVPVGSASSGCGYVVNLIKNLSVESFSFDYDLDLLRSLDNISNQLSIINKTLESLSFNNEIIVDNNSTVNGQKVDYEFSNTFWGR